MKYRVLHLFILGIVFLSLWFSIHFVLTRYLNVCVTRLSVVSDQEKIESAVDYLLNHYAPVIKTFEKRMDGAAINISYKNNFEQLILYKDVNDFLKHNPNCCVLSRTVVGKGFFDFEDTIMITYKVNYIENNQIKSVTAYTSLFFDSCGHVWRGAR